MLGGPGSVSSCLPAKVYLCDPESTPQPSGFLNTCRHTVAGVSRGVADLSRICRGRVAGCREVSRGVARCRGVASCRELSLGLGTFFSPSTIYILFPYSFRILVQNRVYILEYSRIRQEYSSK